MDQSYQLMQSCPNPLSSKSSHLYSIIRSILIVFELPRPEFVTLKIFNEDREEVATLLSDECSAGTHIYLWNAVRQPHGLYYYRLQANTFLETKMFSCWINWYSVLMMPPVIAWSCSDGFFKCCIEWRFWIEANIVQYLKHSHIWIFRIV